MNLVQNNENQYPLASREKGYKDAYHPSPSFPGNSEVRQFVGDSGENHHEKVFWKLQRCCKPRCLICPLLDCSSTIKSNYSNKKISILTNENINCDSKNLVYQISCRICQMKYIGETSQSLRSRINGHKDAIQREKNTLLYKHFRKDDEHKSKSIEELLEVQIVEKIYDLDEDEQLDKNFTERRLMREYYCFSLWIKRQSQRFWECLE